MERWHERESTEESCVQWFDPELARPTMEATADDYPALCRFTRLVNLGMRPASKTIVHVHGRQNEFDDRNGPAQRFYYKVVLSLLHVLRHVDRVPSDQPQDYYRILLDGRAVPDGLSAKEYGRLRRDPAALPIADVPRIALPGPGPRVGGGDDIVVGGSRRGEPQPVHAPPLPEPIRSQPLPPETLAPPAKPEPEWDLIPGMPGHGGVLVFDPRVKEPKHPRPPREPLPLPDPVPVPPVIRPPSPAEPDPNPVEDEVWCSTAFVLSDLYYVSKIHAFEQFTFPCLKIYYVSKMYANEHIENHTTLRKQDFRSYFVFFWGSELVRCKWSRGASHATQN